MNVTIEKLLNQQIIYEHQASLSYLNMAIWADMHQYRGAADFLYRQSEEERTHMMKIVSYLITLGKRPQVPTGNLSVTKDYSDLKSLFKEALANEQKVTRHIHKITATALDQEDFNTFEFLQWFIAEQREEEDTVQTILGMFAMVDKEGVGVYNIDQAIKSLGDGAK